MKNWSYGVNNLYKTGTVFIEEAPWYIFMIGWLAELICEHIPKISFTSTPMKDENGEETTWKEYYGDMNQWWHVKVHIPIFNWTQEKTKTKFLEVPYEKLKLLFPEDSAVFEEEDQET